MEVLYLNWTRCRFTLHYWCVFTQCVRVCFCFPPWQLRVSKEQEHFLVLPDGLAYSEVTGSNLVSKTHPSPDQKYTLSLLPVVPFFHQDCSGVSYPPVTQLVGVVWWKSLVPAWHRSQQGLWISVINQVMISEKSHGWHFFFSASGITSWSFINPYRKDWVEQNCIFFILGWTAPLNVHNITLSYR